MTGKTQQSPTQTVSHDITDREWARRLGIECHHPDGGDNCRCPHYGDPKRYPDCVFKQLNTSHRPAAPDHAASQEK